MKPAVILHAKLLNFMIYDLQKHTEKSTGITLLLSPESIVTYLIQNIILIHFNNKHLFCHKFFFLQRTLYSMIN